MFYSQFILAKKGPLGTIWIAAHLERKLRKNQVADTDIGVSVDSILFPEVPIALRLSSHLLLGVVRIYSRKVNYLFDDCSEALLKVKQAFRSAAVDLPPEQSKAPYHAITLPETFDLDDFELPDNELFQGNYVDHHVSTREQITLQDTLDGVAFPTSQFGPDERFGDGDASLVGLDLDEELFLNKGEAAETSGILIDEDVDPQASVNRSQPVKGDEHNDGASDPSLVSTTSYFSTEAPSTPGLMEEPNLPPSDDHMDEDQNPSESAAKEVIGMASSQPEPSNFSTVEFHANGNCHGQENDKARSVAVELSTESMEFMSSGNAQPPTSTENIEAANDVDSVGNILNDSSLGKEVKIATDIQSNGDCKVDEIGINEFPMPLAENSSIVEVQGCDPCSERDKTDLNGIYPPLSDSRLENDKSPVHCGVLSTLETDRVVVSSGLEPQNVDEPCLNPKVPVTFDSDKNETLSTPSIAVLQACNSRVDHACNGVDNFFGGSNLPAEDDGLGSSVICGREDAPNVSGISTEVQDVTNLSLKDHMTHEVTYGDNSGIDGQLDNMISVENHLEKGNISNNSDLPALEKLLSMPNLPPGQSDIFLVESTPGKEALTEGDRDATGKNIIPGSKRSYTESTLTMQSLNSAESSGASQFKRSVDSVPNDDDLLSSILVGRSSTALKMKPTPPVAELAPAKRQRATLRSSVHKRKVLLDDTTVLHGDVIREQLINTEDIRRLRKKAPCTGLEIWMLQEQFLEDEIFSEPVFTGMSPALRSLHSESNDLSKIKIVQDEGRKGANKDTSTRPTLDEETKSMGTLIPLVDRGDGYQEHGGSLVETSSGEELALGLNGNALHKEMKTVTVDNEVTREISEYDISGEKVEIEIGDEIVRVGREADHSVGDQRCDMQPTREDVSTLEDSCGEKIRDQEIVDVTFSEKLDSDERLDDKCLPEKVEVFATAIVMAEFEDNCLLPANDISVIDSMPNEGGNFPTSQQVMEECQIDESMAGNKDEILASGNLLGDDLKFDCSYSVEADLCCQNAVLTERENLGCLEADPEFVMDSTPIPTHCVAAGVSTDYGRDVIEHDTDFLNVDDDEVAEDYESDMPNTEEQRILDNSGWSSRTRAVANYLQGLFEKETQHGNKEISLESLLTGKSRKEASRLFFETLVLKTKDYIHAEQESSFCDIHIKPRGKLVNSEF